MLGRHADFDDEWEEMPIEHVGVLDEEDDSDEAELPNHVRGQRAHAARRKLLHDRDTHTHHASNHPGQHLDVHDVRGYDWRTRPDADHSTDQPDDGMGYTQLRLDEAEDEEELHAATEYLFQEDMNRIGDMDDDPSAAPISQLAMTKRLLSETQKIAYAGLCCITAYHMLRETQRLEPTEPKLASKNTSEWMLRIMVRLYQHLDIDVREQAMIDSLAHHGILASDLARSLITTHTIPNPGYVPGTVPEPAPEPASAADTAAEPAAESASTASPTAPAPHAPAAPSESRHNAGLEAPAVERTASDAAAATTPVLTDPNSAAQIHEREATGGDTISAQTVERAALHRAEPAQPATQNTLEGVTTEISASAKTITLDIRWTVLCDLFLVLTADSVYDARSRVLLERVAEALSLTWMDLTKFEKRITDALEIEEDVQTLDDKRVSQRREASAQKKRMMMMGLATVGGGLVIGLSAGLLAPVIGAGIGAALGAVGISGTSAFFGGVGGAAAITTTGTLGGAALGGRGMSRRTRSVKTFEFRPMHNHKRVNCIVTVPGFLRGPEDDPTLPFGVIDPVMGDAFSIMWEPEMMREMGNAMSILWNETLVQGVQQVLAATVAGAMFSALAWPLWLTKLNYIIDNPWSNATERARAAGLILADVLMNRQLGVRPITLVGFSLGARMIYYALRELAHRKAYGIVQNVYLLGAPVSARESEWKQVRSVVAGRFVNAYSRSDWLLAYLHRATSGGLHSIAGLHPIEYDCAIENVDVTHLVPGHLSYRVLTPLVLSELGFKTTADYFDEPESLDQVPERDVVFDAGPLDPPATPRSKLSLKNFFSRKNVREERTAAALSAAVQKTAAQAQQDQSEEADETHTAETQDAPTTEPSAAEGAQQGAEAREAAIPHHDESVPSEAPDTQQSSMAQDAAAPLEHDAQSPTLSTALRPATAASTEPDTSVAPAEPDAATPDAATPTTYEAHTPPPEAPDTHASPTPAPVAVALDLPSEAAEHTPSQDRATPTEPSHASEDLPPEAGPTDPAPVTADAAHSQAPASPTAAASSYGLSSEEAQRLASQFHNLSMRPPMEPLATEEWDTPAFDFPSALAAPESEHPTAARPEPASLAGGGAARLPEWAAENPWG